MGCGSSGTDMGPLYNAQGVANRNENIAVSQIKNAFAGYTPNWAQGIAQAYQNQAIPQLQQQYKTNANQFGFNMADQGLQKSTQNQQGQQALQQNYQQGLTNIAQQGQAAAQNLQQQAASQENNLIGMAQTATQPGQLVPQAAATAAQYQTPSVFQPIGNAFSSFAGQYLGGQQAATGNQLSSLLTNYFNPINNPSGSYAGAIPQN